MGELAKFFSEIEDFLVRVFKAIPKLTLTFDHQQESKKEATLEIGKNGACIKRKLHNKKSSTSFSIGISVSVGDNKLQLFISVNNAHLLLAGKYLLPTPTCCNEEPSNEEGEICYTASELINNDYFSETTPESRKDEIIEQILTEVVKSLN